MTRADRPHVLYVLDYNCWVIDCDIDTPRFTRDRTQAKVFPNFLTALEYWKRQSTTVPLRDDGKPNRPLTAYTVSPQPETP